MLIDICRFNRRWKRVPSRLRTNQTYQNFNYSAEIVVMNSISLSIKMYLRLYHHSLSLCLSLSPLLLHTFPSWSLSLSSCFYLCIIMLLLCVSFSNFLLFYILFHCSLSLSICLYHSFVILFLCISFSLSLTSTHFSIVISLSICLYLSIIIFFLCMSFFFISLPYFFTFPLLSLCPRLSSCLILSLVSLYQFIFLYSFFISLSVLAYSCA